MRGFALIDRSLNRGLERAEGLLGGLQDLSLVNLENCGRDLVRSFWSIATSFVLLLFQIAVVLVYALSVKEKHELVFIFVKSTLNLQPPLGDD